MTDRDRAIQAHRDAISAHLDRIDAAQAHAAANQSWWERMLGLEPAIEADLYFDAAIGAASEFEKLCKLTNRRKR